MIVRSLAVALAVLTLTACNNGDDGPRQGLAPGLWAALAESFAGEPRTLRPQPLVLIHHETGEHRVVAEPRAYFELLFSPDGHYLAAHAIEEVETAPGADLPAFRETLHFIPLGEAAGPEAVAELEPGRTFAGWSPDGTALALVAGDTLEIWGTDGSLAASVGREALGFSWRQPVWSAGSTYLAILVQDPVAPRDLPVGPGVLILRRDGTVIERFAHDDLPDGETPGNWRLHWIDDSTLELSRPYFGDNTGDYTIAVKVSGDGAILGERQPVAGLRTPRDLAEVALFRVLTAEMDGRFPGHERFGACGSLDPAIPYACLWDAPGEASLIQARSDLQWPKGTRGYLLVLRPSGAFTVVDLGIAPTGDYRQHLVEPVIDAIILD